jgi:hypothetical protein
MTFVVKIKWNGTPKDHGELWTLKKAERVATCRWWSHPLAIELRCTVDGEFAAVRSRARPCSNVGSGDDVESAIRGEGLAER